MFLLCIGLLEQSAPKLVVLFRMEKHESSVVGGKEIVDDDVDPFAVLPKSEVKYSCILVLLEALVVRYDLEKHFRAHRQVGDGSEKPAITLATDKKNFRDV